LLDTRNLRKVTAAQIGNPHLLPNYETGVNRQAVAFVYVEGLEATIDETSCGT
jgi:hypothetical protein